MIILECDNCQKQENAPYYPNLPGIWCELSKMIYLVGVNSPDVIEKKHVCSGECLKDAVNKKSS